MSKKISISLIVFAALLVGLWIWTIAMPKTSISIGGSSSVDPIIQRMTNKYFKQTKNNFIYSSTGSQSGITNMENGVYKIGFTSKDVEDDSWVDDYENWYLDPNKNTYINYLLDSQENIHYATFAKDSFVFIFNPTQMNFEPFEKFLSLSGTYENSFFKLSSSSIGMLHAIYDVDKPNDLITWRQLAQLMWDKNIGDINNETGWSNEKASQMINNVKTEKIIPYSTAPGSGTRSTFTKMSGVDPGTAVNIYPSNGAVFSQIESSPGSFGYVSMSYAKFKATMPNEMKNIESLNVVVDGTKYDPIELYKEQKLYLYPLSRPFNAIFNPKNLSKSELEKVANFILFLTLDEQNNNSFEEEGLIRPWLSNTNNESNSLNDLSSPIKQVKENT